jgi:glycosyltransferase involved in cell wall biosynthesis
LQVPPNKIKTFYLAADQPEVAEVDSQVPNVRITSMDWRFIHAQRRLSDILIDDVPYLLCIGGADPRRRIQDLITAFNHVRSLGFACRLLLVGFDFQSLDKIPNDQVKEAIRNSSFGDDIYLLGFIDSIQKFYLYQKAIVFIYPTVYEGFGLPVLEAMINKCPVICYKNSSLEEVGGNAAIYVTDADGIADSILKLIEQPKYRTTLIEKGLKSVNKFTWQKTTHKFIKLVKEYVSGLDA